MKITKTVRRLYDEQLELRRLLSARVRELFESAKKEEWFYRGRVKTDESFALKLETGRVEDPAQMEDFFACTLVVENAQAIDDAIALVERFCEVIYRRPPVASETHKRAEAFPFDDLRLYARLKEENRPESELSKITFEIQIKTFLQHAWSIATHDLVYKGDHVNWGRARVAYQIKAMLEHAEVSIQQAEQISRSTVLAKTDKPTRDLIQILDWLKTTWDEEALPHDLVRLAEITGSLLEAIGIPFEHLRQAIQDETAIGEGTHLRDLSPYGIMLRALFRRQSDQMQRFVKKPRRFKLFITDEMEIPEIRNRNISCVIFAETDGDIREDLLGALEKPAIDDSIAS